MKEVIIELRASNNSVLAVYDSVEAIRCARPGIEFKEGKPGDIGFIFPAKTREGVALRYEVHAVSK